MYAEFVMDNQILKDLFSRKDWALPKKVANTDDGESVYSSSYQGL
jgi:hypothetical protein